MDAISPAAEVNMISVQFQDRKFKDILLPGLLFEVKKYSRRALGGPANAEITVRGAREDLYALLNWCRFNVKIYDDNGVCV
jgi:hypothetical protein